MQTKQVTNNPTQYKFDPYLPLYSNEGFKYQWVVFRRPSANALQGIFMWHLSFDTKAECEEKCQALNEDDPEAEFSVTYY